MPIATPNLVGVSPPLPTSTRVDPIRAHKYALIGIEAGDTSARPWVVHFSGIGSQAAYSADAEAHCVGYPSHQAPRLDCRCGFYAVQRSLPYLASVPIPPGGSGTIALPKLDVELYGRIIRHTRGWRASKQRVLKVEFGRSCGCGNEATALANYVGSSPISGGTFVFPVCLAHVPTAETQVPMAIPMIGAETSFVPLAIEPVVLTPAELANLLGTEVRWS